MDMYMNKLVIGIPLLVIGFITYFLSPIYDALGLLTFVNTIVYGAGQGLVASGFDLKKLRLMPLTGCRDSFIVLLLFPILLCFPGVGYTYEIIVGLTLGLFLASNVSQDTESIKE